MKNSLYTAVFVLVLCSAGIAQQTGKLIETVTNGYTTATSDGDLLIRVRFGINKDGRTADPATFKALIKTASSWIELNNNLFSDVKDNSGFVVGKFGKLSKSHGINFDGLSLNKFKFRVSTKEAVRGKYYSFQKGFSCRVKQSNLLPTAKFTTYVLDKIGKPVQAQMLNGTLTIFENSIVSLDGTPSISNLGKVTEYYWNFGGGFTSAGFDSKAYHTFKQAGSYELILSVKDNYGAVSNQSKITVVVISDLNINIK